MRIEVAGTPVSQGSLQPFPVPRKGTGRYITVDGRKVWTGRHLMVMKSSNDVALKAWRSAVGAEARRVATRYPGAVAAMFHSAVEIDLTFRLQRPASASERKRPYPHVKPDLDKLTRAVFDALTGVLYKDDAQVCRLHVQKIYVADAPGVEIHVRPVVSGDALQFSEE